MKNEIGHSDLAMLGTMIILAVFAVTIAVRHDIKKLEERVYALEHGGAHSP